MKQVCWERSNHCCLAGERGVLGNVASWRKSTDGCHTEGEIFPLDGILVLENYRAAVWPGSVPWACTVLPWTVQLDLLSRLPNAKSCDVKPKHKVHTVFCSWARCIVPCNVLWACTALPRASCATSQSYRQSLATMKDVVGLPLFQACLGRPRAARNVGCLL